MKIRTSICSLLALCSCLYFTSCSDDELGGASQNLSVALFYPTIVMEGTEVEVNGTALSRVTEVVFPGGITSTDITVVDDRILTVIAPAGVSGPSEMRGGETMVDIPAPVREILEIRKII